MTDDNPTLAEVAARGQPIAGRDRLLTHPWNVVHPRPEPAKGPAPRYRLTVRHNSEKRTGSDELVSAQAECDSMDRLLDLNDQFIALDYHFVTLELLDGGDRDLADHLHP